MNISPRLKGWLLPGISIAIAAIAIFNRHSAFTALSQREVVARHELEEAQAAKKKMEEQPVDGRYAAEERSPTEETKFLDELRNRAKAAGVTIVRWSSHTSTYDKNKAGGPPSPTQAKDEEAVKGLTKVSCDLAVSGAYPALRRFVAGLSTSPRLYTLSNVDWNRSDTGSELAMTLGRYLAPAAPPTDPSTNSTSHGITESA